MDREPVLFTFIFSFQTVSVLQTEAAVWTKNIKSRQRWEKLIDFCHLLLWSLQTVCPLSCDVTKIFCCRSKLHECTNTWFHCNILQPVTVCLTVCTSHIWTKFCSIGTGCFQPLYVLFSFEENVIYKSQVELFALLLVHFVFTAANYERHLQATNTHCRLFSPKEHIKNKHFMSEHKVLRHQSNKKNIFYSVCCRYYLQIVSGK